MKNFNQVAATFTACALAAAVLAQTTAELQKPTTPDTPKLDFATLDSDANGKLLKAETVSIAELDAAFEKLDADHDGALSPAEFSKWDRAGRTGPRPRDPTTVPGGSAGAQHMPPPN